MPSVSHGNVILPFKPGQILLAIYHSQTKLDIFLQSNKLFLSPLVTEKVIFQPHTEKFSISDKKQNE